MCLYFQVAQIMELLHVIWNYMKEVKLDISMYDLLTVSYKLQLLVFSVCMHMPAYYISFSTCTENIL